MSWYRYDATGTKLSLTLHVQPGAKKTEVVGLHGSALKIKVAAPATEGAANAALIKFLAQTLGAAPRDVTIKSGASSRSKVVEVLSPVTSVESLLD